MKRLLALIPAALLASAAIAQEAPAEAYQNLWCGIAFGTAASDAPYTPEQLEAAKAAGDAATDEQKQVIAQDEMAQQFIQGGAGLVETATAAYKTAGFTDEAFATIKTELEPKVAEQIRGSGDAAEFSFEQCVVLLPTPEAPAQ